MGKAEAAGDGTLPARPCALPDPWIERIFGHMEALYGARFLDAWRGTDLDAVRATWARRLAGFIDQPQRIRFALDALDAKPFPPTLPEFLELCRQAPRTTLKALPEPKCDAETACRHLAAMNEIVRGKMVTR